MAERRHKWIKTAINPAHKGQFRAKAERAGESTHAFAEEHKDDSGSTGKQARLALTLMGMHHKGSGRAERRYSDKTVSRPNG
jgi:hypothetical protein